MRSVIAVAVLLYTLPAFGECELVRSLEVGFARVDSAHGTAHLEGGVEFLGVGSCQLPIHQLQIYGEAGLGLTTALHFTVPLGVGFIYEVNNRIAAGFAATIAPLLLSPLDADVVFGPIVQFKLPHHMSVGLRVSLVRHLKGFVAEGDGFGGSVFWEF